MEKQIDTSFNKTVINQVVLHAQWPLKLRPKECCAVFSGDLSSLLSANSLGKYQNQKLMSWVAATMRTLLINLENLKVIRKIWLQPWCQTNMELAVSFPWRSQARPSVTAWAINQTSGSTRLGWVLLKLRRVQSYKVFWASQHVPQYWTQSNVYGQCTDLIHLRSKHLWATPD